MALQPSDIYSLDNIENINNNTTNAPPIRRLNEVIISQQNEKIAELTEQNGKLKKDNDQLTQKIEEKDLIIVKLNEEVLNLKIQIQIIMSELQIIKPRTMVPEAGFHDFPSKSLTKLIISGRNPSEKWQESDGEVNGIILFIHIEQQHNKHEKEEIIRNKIIYPFTSIVHDNFMPITCPYNPPNGYEIYLVTNTLDCGRSRSSLIHIFYFNYSRPINYDENIVINNTSIPPNVQLSFDFLTKMNFNSFVLILIDLYDIGGGFKLSITLVLHWIRYFSSFVEDGYDICQYKDLYSEKNKPHDKIVLLYATNSSQTMIIAKTICYIKLDWDTLTSYIKFTKLELVATMKFQII
ncbi:unnamed protein product [Adineta steineri]|uniref:Uncharacterized protein n=1 Tax=Adineta steineri TaxID=433720 RepID=A0A818TM57_9BILA|nr:unnamed protein product [Adineta steineri]